MQLTINEFSSSDWGQYFNDTYIQYQSSKGVRIGRIESFLGQGRVMVHTGGTSVVISRDAILWRGLIRTRCVVWNDCLAFVGPSGARSHKKPPTSTNMSALVYNRGRIPMVLGNGHDHVSHDLIIAYLEDDDIYPTTRHDIRSLLENRCAVALSPRAGIFLSRSNGSYYGIADGLVQVSTDNTTTIMTWAEEVRNDVS